MEPPAAGLGGKSLSCSFVNNCFDGGREIEELKFEMSQKHHTPEIFFLASVKWKQTVSESGAAQDTSPSGGAGAAGTRQLDS